MAGVSYAPLSSAVPRKLIYTTTAEIVQLNLLSLFPVKPVMP